MRKKFVFMAGLNLAIVYHCVRLYFQGYSIQRILVILLLSVAVLNVVAEMSWKSALKRKNRQSDSKE
jgi:hypothetical protein